ncbi:MAG: hypothetical protein C5B50_01680 [Verrucomicrobia bacterium]|nr:MAG: hypothetical protein C5B50_01680 [Verrucomicrobiota bacterium]
MILSLSECRQDTIILKSQNRSQSSASMSKPPIPEETRTAEYLLHKYSAVTGAYDELQEQPGVPRAHWSPLVDSLQQLDRHELESRWENGRRIIREHGVTYNVYGDPQAIDRPWGLDFIPFIIPGEEWALLEAGLAQRSRLFNLVLADLYTGSQRLLRDGFIPPELVYANPGFLRPCRGIQVPSKVYLHLLACDLARSPNGQWWVLSDRTQAPSGMGYAWENRTVVSRVLPDQIRQSRAQPLAGFFQRQREMLFDLAPAGADRSSVVLLTPGPNSETYFEHAYLARSLGFPLVEGPDLTVRDRGVFLKTIEGLQPVGVILRRVDDAWCDPLELRGDSLLGISGLAEATRAGKVTVANALGAGLIESPAFLAFLPGLCRHLLAEELLLPSVATWWCGQAKELRYVIEHLDSLIVKPAFGSSVSSPIPPMTAAMARHKRAEHRAKFVELIEAAPRDFVAQERMKLSRAPAWAEGCLAPRAAVIRGYVANGGKSITVMPGGLARISKNPRDLAPALHSGTISKDIWVLSGAPQNVPEPAPITGETRFIERGLTGVSSRAADHLFWLGRYTERLEQLLRVLRCVLGRAAAEPGAGNAFEHGGLAELAFNLGVLSEKEIPPAGNGELTPRMLHLLYDQDEPSGVRDLLRCIRSASLAVRDRFSGDTWRILGRLDADARARPGRLALASATGLSHNLVLDLAAFNGMEMENMTRGRGWRFLDFGRRIERGMNVLKLSRAAVSVQTPAAALEPVLEIADSLMTYRRQHFTAPQLHHVLELVIREESNPRSLAFQINLLRDHVAALGADVSPASPPVEGARIQALADALRTTDLTGLAVQQASGEAHPLVAIFDAWSTELAALSDEVTNRYFSHSGART